MISSKETLNTIMDPNQDEELKKLSSRTEELLNRLNELSSNLNTQLKSQPVQAPKAVVPNPQPSPPAAPSSQLPQTPPEATNYYTLPINTQYLEKREKRIKTTGLGSSFLTSTSIFTEQHHFQGPIQNPSENLIPAKNLNTPSETAFPGTFPEDVQQTSIFSEPASSTPLAQGHHPYQPYQPHPEGEAKPTHRPFKTSNIYNPVHFPKPSESVLHDERNRSTMEETNSSPSGPLKPAAIFSYDDQEKTKRAAQPYRARMAYREDEIKKSPEPEAQNKSSDLRTQELANQIAAKNKEIKDRLHKYSSRVQVSSQVDNLKLFAWLVLVFSPIVPITLIKDDFLLAFACSTLALFFGIFFSMMALRLVEISELVRWAHNQILNIQKGLDETKEP